MYKKNNNRFYVNNFKPVALQNDVYNEDYIEFNELYGENIEAQILENFKYLKEQVYYLFENITSSIIENFFMSFVDILDHLYISSSDEEENLNTEEDLL